MPVHIDTNLERFVAFRIIHKTTQLLMLTLLAVYTTQSRTPQTPQLNAQNVLCQPSQFTYSQTDSEPRDSFVNITIVHILAIATSSLLEN